MGAASRNPRVTPRQRRGVAAGHPHASPVGRQDVGNLVGEDRICYGDNDRFTVHRVIRSGHDDIKAYGEDNLLRKRPEERRTCTTGPRRVSRLASHRVARWPDDVLASPPPFARSDRAASTDSLPRTQRYGVTDRSEEVAMLYVSAMSQCIRPRVSHLSSPSTQQRLITAIRRIVQKHASTTRTQNLTQLKQLWMSKRS